jgi:serine/threonine protein kinase
MNSINYYKKYTKYKSKYLEKKNNLLGAGENGNIEFQFLEITREKSISLQVNQNITEFINTLKENLEKGIITITITKDNNENEMFQLLNFIAEGGNGVVFKLLHLVKKENMIIKLSKIDYSSSIEGISIDCLIIDPKKKALYQGKKNIDFAIYKYLGEDTNKFFTTNIYSINFLFEKFWYLFYEIYILNINLQFHNDVKLDNSVVDQFNNLSLIDYGLVTFSNSNRGTIISTCMRGVIEWLLQAYQYDISKIPSFLVNLDNIKQYAVSTDIVGYLNIVLDILFIQRKRGMLVFTLYSIILGNLDYNFTTLTKLLCFFCIVSFNRNPYIILKADPYCKDIIEKLETKLYSLVNFVEIEKYYKLEINDNNRGYLSYTYLIFINLGFNTEGQFKFLLNLILFFLNSSFDILNFYNQYPTLFNLEFLTPYLY